MIKLFKCKQNVNWKQDFKNSLGIIKPFLSGKTLFSWVFACLRAPVLNSSTAFKCACCCFSATTSANRHDAKGGAKIMHKSLSHAH